MHAAMSGLLLFILQIVETFDQKLREVASGLVDDAVSSSSGSSGASTPGLDMFQSQDLTLITGMITMVMLVLAIANSLAPKFASGGHTIKMAWSGSIMFIISGINMMVVPPVANSVLSGQ